VNALYGADLVVAAPPLPLLEGARAFFLVERQFEDAMPSMPCV
jgi:hypothetical protein